VLYELFLLLIIWSLMFYFGRSWITLDFFGLQNVFKSRLVCNLKLSIRTIIGLVWLKILIWVKLMFAMIDLLITSLWLKYLLIIDIVLTTLFLKLIHRILHLVALHNLILHLSSFLKVFVQPAFKILNLIALRLFMIVKRLDFSVLLIIFVITW